MIAAATAAATVNPLLAKFEYVGRLADSEAFIGISTQNDDVLAYVCDGLGKSVNVAQWFKGKMISNSVAITAGGGFNLNASVAGGDVTGTVTLKDGSKVAFTAGRAEFPAGFYRAEFTIADNSYVGGWIVLPNGEQRGAIVNRTTGVAVPSNHLSFAGSTGK